MEFITSKVGRKASALKRGVYNLGGCRSIQLSYERNPDFVVILQGHVKLSVF